MQRAVIYRTSQTQSSCIGHLLVKKYWYAVNFIAQYSRVKHTDFKCLQT